MIKVLMSSTTPMIKDGITNVMLNLYRYIDNKKIHVDFVTINEPEKSIRNKILNNGGKYTVIERSIKHPIRYIQNYSKVCKGYDIVHVHGNSATMFLEMCAAKMAGVRIRIGHSHNTYCRAKLIDKLFRIPFYTLCDSRLACGKEAGEWLFGNRDFTIINNGIDSERFRFNEANRNRIREELGWKDCKVIGHVGNFLPAKNHSYILDIFAELNKKDTSYRLILIGSGELVEEVQNKAIDLGVSEYVVFAGSVDNVEDYLSAIDLVLMPSIHEGLPLTLIEEQANGLSCIVSDNITKYADLTGNIKFISLNEKVSVWVNNIVIELKHVNSEDRGSVSKDAIETISLKHYDIHKSITILEKIYENRLEK